ncbi:MAG: PEP/pyruvate-binding domain-containing protein, partial [Spirochaetales bacterium]
AYFAINKAHHSNHATDTIYSTAQIIIEVYSHRGNLYIQPQKVENRYSSTMFMLHIWKGDSFLPVTNSATTAEIVGPITQPRLNFTIQRFGFWTQTYHDAQALLQAIQRGERSPEDTKPYFELFLRMVITRQKPFLSLAREFFDLPFLIDIMKRLIGSGLIGGKARGILLAQRILQRDYPEWARVLEPHDSFFIGSDVFYTYIIQNDCWWLRRKTGLTMDQILANAKIARERILKGKFLDYITVQFQEMLEYFGQSPIIVRSSSLQEDSYGNSFSGKYESVFCANQGTPSQRLAEFLDAVRTVYASSMDEDALMYRLHHGLLYEDEQMALLVQRVSGDQNRHYFFPLAAGVGFSYNPYVWDKEIDPHSGVLRLAFGLGTRAVDRVEDDYTRIVALNAPFKRPEKSEADSHKYTQREVDLVDLQANRFATYPLRKILSILPDHLKPLFLSEDLEQRHRAEEAGISGVFPWRLTFEGLFRNTDFIERMREMLATLQKAYKNPVDTEFTVNVLEDGSYRVNLVQCRPFMVRLLGTGDIGILPDNIHADKVLLKSDGPIVGQSVATRIDRLIYVSPSNYTKLGQQARYSIARLIGELTQLPSTQQPLVIMLIGPGRWGTSTPAMGVPVTFKEIKTVSIIVELAMMHEGLVPDVSLGTHFFNDLVEMEMLYFAVFPDRENNQYNGQVFRKYKNRLLEICPKAEEWADTVIVWESPNEAGLSLYLHADSMKQFALCYMR